MMRCSVVIPARNAESELAGCLGALGSGTIVPREVIVVDDGSTDTTREVARARGATVIRQPARGPAAARNTGAAASSGELLAFFDADCVPEPTCLEALLAPFQDPTVSGVRGAYTTDQRALLARFVQLELDEKQARLAGSRMIAVVDTACAAYRRSVFSSSGGFDESFPPTSVEDVELSFRLMARGERLVYAPDARVRHRHPERLSIYLWRKLRFGYYRARLYGRYPSRMREDGYTPRLMPLQIALSGVLAVSFAGSAAFTAPRGLAVATGIAFLAITLPMARRGWSKDPRLGALVPVLLLGRSLAQGLGLLAGFISQVVDRGRARRAPV